MNNRIINKNDKFVACWGYDQTQYSVYNVVDLKGKFVFVEGLNSWSNLSEKDLAVGSQVKVYQTKRWDNLSAEDQQDWASRGFDRWGYERHFREEAENAAEVRTITKMNRINGESWSYLWVLDNGETVNSKEAYKNGTRVHIVKGLKRCLVQPSKWDDNFYIKIDDVITARLDKDYEKSHEAYEKQNEYTAYNGR